MLKGHNLGVLCFIFLNLLHLELYTLPELHMFLDISVENKASRFLKGHYSIAYGYRKWIKQVLISGFLLLQKASSLMFHVVLHRQVDKKEEIGEVCKGGVFCWHNTIFLYWNSLLFSIFIMNRNSRLTYSEELCW